MSSNKKNNLNNYNLIDTPVIVINDEEIAVSKPTARAFYIMQDTMFVHNMITFFFVVGITMYLVFYFVYSYENNKLIKEASRSCPVFSCPNLTGKTPPVCQGHAFHLRPGGEVVCTQ